MKFMTKMANVSNLGCKLAFVLVLCLTMLSCNDDLGNYTYRDLNAMSIDSIEPVEVKVFDMLHLKAVVRQSMFADDSNIDYMWYYYPDGTGSRRDTIGYGSELQYHLVMQPAKYDFYVTATDRNTGLWAKRKVEVRVESQFANGLLLLGSGVNVSACLDFLSLSNSNKGAVTHIYLPEDADKIGYNPVSITEADNELVLLCNDEHGGCMLNKGTLLKSKDIDEVFSFKPQTIVPQFHGRVDRVTYSSQVRFNDVMLIDGNVHMRREGEEMFSPPLSGRHDVAPFVYSYRNAAVFYDNKTTCFYRLDFSDLGQGISLGEFPEPETGTISPSALGLKALFLCKGRTRTDLTPALYGIFSDETGQLYDVCCAMEYSWMDGMLMQYITKKPLGENDAPGLARATCFSSYDMNSAVIYYAVDDKLYLYNAYTGASAELAFSLSDIGEKGYITALQTNTILGGDMATHTGTTLYVAFTRSNLQEGGVVQLTIADNTTGRIVSVDNKWIGVTHNVLSILLR